MQIAVHIHWNGRSRNRGLPHRFPATKEGQRQADAFMRRWCGNCTHPDMHPYWILID